MPRLWANRPNFCFINRGGATDHARQGEVLQWRRVVLRCLVATKRMKRMKRMTHRSNAEESYDGELAQVREGKLVEPCVDDIGRRGRWAVGEPWPSPVDEVAIAALDLPSQKTPVPGAVSSRSGVLLHARDQALLQPADRRQATDNNLEGAFVKAPRAPGYTRTGLELGQVGVVPQK